MYTYHFKVIPSVVSTFHSFVTMVLVFGGQTVVAHELATENGMSIGKECLLMCSVR